MGWCHATSRITALRRQCQTECQATPQLGQLYTHTHPFNGPFSGTTWVSRYQKDQTNLDFTEARDSEWQWHQLGHMQVCTLLQIDNHASTQPLKFFYRLDALPATQPTALKHWRLADYTQSSSIHSSTEYTCNMQHRLSQLIWSANYTSISIVFYTRYYLVTRI